MMYELIFTILVITKTGVPGFNIEHISRFQIVEECEKTKKSMESYMDKLSNRHWRGLVVLNEVEDGCFDEMMLSIEYLEKKYGKL